MKVPLRSVLPASASLALAVIALFLPAPLTANPSATEPAACAEEPAVDLGGFGSGEPEQQREYPVQGQLVFHPDEGETRIMEHWDQYDWAFEADGSGHYLVVMRYKLQLTSLGVQFHHPDSETRLRALLRHNGADQWTTVELGEIHFAQAGPTQFSIYTPSLNNRDSFRIKDIRLIPAPDPAAPSNRADP